MIDSIDIKNFGPIDQLEWSNLGKINILIGSNGCGKTFILKILYSAIRCLEEYRKGNDPRKIEDVLSDKLYWTFQVEKLSDLVQKGTTNLHFRMKFDNEEFNYSFGNRTEKEIRNVENTIPERNKNSVFLPAKEILSLFDAIKISREQFQTFGFDDTYYDLVKALTLKPIQGRNYPEFAQSRKTLEELLNGKIQFENEKWSFKNANNQVFPVHITSEGLKKVSILDRLLGNHYLSSESILFVDEPEAALHPNALVQFLEILKLLSDTGIQIFISTHSYFVIKKLYIIANRNNIKIPIALFENNEYRLDNLLNGMPVNSIITESVALYEEEVELAFQ